MSQISDSRSLRGNGRSASWGILLISPFRKITFSALDVKMGNLYQNQLDLHRSPSYTNILTSKAENLSFPNDFTKSPTTYAYTHNKSVREKNLPYLPVSA